MKKIILNNKSQDRDKMIDDIRPFLDFHKKPEIVGIILYGGWGRGEQTEYSDIDIGIICDNETVTKRYQDEYDSNWKCGEHIIETIYYDYQSLWGKSLPKRCSEDKGCFWTEDTRFNWQNAVILYDPTENIQKLITEKTCYPIREQTENITTLIWVIERNLNYLLPRLLNTDQYAEAQMLMNRTIVGVIHYLYSQNGLLMPYENIAFYWFYKNNLPNKKIIEKLFNHSKPNKKDCTKRIQIFWEVCDKLKIEVKQQSIQDFAEAFFEAKEWTI